MLSLAFCLLLQDVLAEDFERELVRDAIYPGWERVQDGSHPLYNAIAVEKGALVMRSLGRDTALRHRGRDADPRLSYRLAGTVTAEGGRAWMSLRWLDKDGRKLREDPAEAEHPPDGSVRVQVVLHFRADVRGEARFDSIRLTASPRLDVRPVGRALPVFTHRERVAVSIEAPALENVEVAGRLLDADGNAVRALDAALSADALPPAAYRLVATASRGGAILLTREAWVYVTGPPLFDPPDPPFGIFLRDAGLADVAGARHVALEFDAPLVAGLARRPDTSITALGKPDARFLQEVDHWAPRVEVVRVAGSEEALARAFEVADRRVYFDADLAAAYALRTLNDLLGGARRARSPDWAAGARAWTKAGRAIVAAQNAEVKPPPGWLLVDPLLGRREVTGSVQAGTRTVFLVAGK